MGEGRWWSLTDAQVATLKRLLAKDTQEVATDVGRCPHGFKGHCSVCAATDDFDHCCFAGCIPKPCGCCVNAPFGHRSSCPESPAAQLRAYREAHHARPSSPLEDR